MTTKDKLLQEIEQASEPLLEEILEFIRSRKMNQDDPLEAVLDQLLASGDDADDVTPEELAAHDAAVKDYLEGSDRGIPLEELKLELLEQRSE